jgi:2-oxoglutarate ferredoxin oxidoreductase subunit alpha
MDYLSATRGGGGGGYKNIVLAPASVQECCDLVQLAFYLADKYRNPVVVLSDGLLGQMMEPLEVRTLDFGPLPEKDWALEGSALHKDGKRRALSCLAGFSFQEVYESYLDFIQHLDEKYRQMADSEVRYETYRIDDAHLLVVAYGYAARVSLEAASIARDEGLKVGLIRPISLWPFPSEVIRRGATQGADFLVVEDSLGQLVEDVRLSVGGQAEVHLLNMLSRHMRTPAGMILPDIVLEGIRKLA